ncbi:hypothetical protein [Streptomyces sp. KL116D]|uniref:hypothetical protein n=1 Tax=Streptomyces sp. KL116D TaxID=3045152 RepID=UPI003558227F
MACGRGRSDTWSLTSLADNIKAPATISIAMFQWTSHGEPGDRNYLELPKKLVSLAQTGVKINILFTAGQVDASVQNYLEDRPNIDVHDPPAAPTRMAMPCTTRTTST